MEGHKSPDCPQKKSGSVPKKSIPVTKISVLRAGSVDKKNVIVGKVNGVKCQILVDTGADVAMVPRKLVGFGCKE